VVRERVGFRSIDTKWGAAWALCLLDDPLAEGLLAQLHARRPTVATFAALLAHSQMVRGKVQSALRNAETAIRLEPSNRTITEVLVQMLLAVGRVREADERLKPFAEDARNEPTLAYLMVRAALMQRDLVRAREWADVIRSFDEAGEGLLAVAYAFGQARLDDVAAEFFTAALEAGYAPEANIGLAMVARFRGDPVASRRHLLAALRAQDAKFSARASPTAVFQQVLAGLAGLEERRVSCGAWIATFPNADMPLSQRSVVVHSTTEAAAHEHLREIVEAIQPEGSPFDMSRVRWRKADPDDQPVRPVEPGVNGIVG
jgi:tetratricopeptide (TPR) repeat protein